MAELSDYGEIAQLYEGEGKLLIKGEGDISCTFKAAQYHDGNLYLQCKYPNTKTYPLEQYSGEVWGFEGTTITGRPFQINGNLLILNRSYIIETSDIVDILTPSNGAKFQYGSLSKGVKKIVFKLSNYLFVGNQNLEFEGRNITIVPTRDYQQRKRILKNLRNPQITSSLEIEISEIDDLKAFCESVETLCLILTLARGTKISWLFFNLLNHDNEVIYSEHVDAITRRFQSPELISYKDNPATVSLIDACTKRYEQVNELFGFRELASSFLDMRSPEIFLQTRGLLIGSIIDSIASRLAERNQRATFFEKKNSINKKLRKGVRDLIRVVLPDLDEADVFKIGDKASGFYRRPYLEKILYLCSEYNVPVTEAECNQFKDSRNKLVHTADFDTEDRRSEFLKMQYFLDRIVLGIVGYEGEYLNSATFELDEFVPKKE